ncbi:hypothetical protein DSO57_1036261 [Entomophthora muscae]|nr:hypothetical protein DSO57_1036261 [Entomophthora muscae]
MQSYIKTSSTKDVHMFTGATKDLCFIKEKSLTYTPGNQESKLMFLKHKVTGTVFWDNIILSGKNLEKACFFEPSDLENDIAKHEEGFLKHPAAISLSSNILPTPDEPITRLMTLAGSSRVTIEAYSDKEFSDISFKFAEKDEFPPGTASKNVFFDSQGYFNFLGDSVSFKTPTGAPQVIQRKKFKLTESPLLYLPEDDYKTFQATFTDQTSDPEGLQTVQCHELHELPTFLLKLSHNTTIEIPPRSYVHVTEKGCILLVTKSSHNISFLEVGLPLFRDRAITLDYSEKRLFIGSLQKNIASSQTPPPLAPPNGTSRSEFFAMTTVLIICLWWEFM